MNINHENIDKWLFDLAEGNLNSSQKRELTNFIQAHPEYKSDYDLWMNSRLEDADIPAFQGEDQLHDIAGKPFLRKVAPYAAVLLLFGTTSASLYYSGIFNKSENGLSENNIQSYSANELNEITTTPSTHTSAFIADDHTNNPEESGNTFTETQIHPTDNATKKAGVSTLPHSNSIIHKTDNNQIPVISNTNSGPYLNNSNINNGIPVSVVNSIEQDKKQHSIINTTGLFIQKPEISFEAVVKRMSDEVTVTEYETPLSNNAKGTSKDEVTHHIEQQTLASKIKKHFFDADLGFYNTRDHILMHPGTNNTMTYSGFAGSSVSPAFSMNYRNQYTGSGFASHQGLFVYDQYSRKLRSAWGFAGSFTNYGDGMYEIRSGHVFYSPKIKINKKFTIEPGITGTYSQHIAGARVHNNSILMEPVRGSVGRSAPAGINSANRIRSSFDVSLSTLVNTKYFYSAVAVDNIIGTHYSIYKPESTNFMNSGLVFKALIGTDYKRFHESKWKVSPQISFLKQGAITELWAGSLLSYEKLHFGLSGSQNKQVLGVAGVTAGIFRFNYQFDYSKSYLDGKYYGSHELGMRIALTGLQRKPSAILDNEK